MNVHGIKKTQPVETVMAFTERGFGVMYNRQQHLQ